jgi:hypothetical protein
MPQHLFHLRPVIRPPGDVEVLMCTDRGIEAVIPRPGSPRGAEVCLVGFADSAWTPAHMQRLFAFVGWNRRNVAVARPHGAAMVLTVVEEAPEPS